MSKEAQSGKTVFEQIATPGNFAKTVRLGAGLAFAGLEQKECLVGPLTDAAEGAAEATMPDFIDDRLIYRSFLWRTLTPEQRAEAEIDAAEVPPVTDAENRRAIIMDRAKYRHQCKHRVIRFGAIPPGDIPAALGKLLPADMERITDACREVDDAVRRFCEENAPDLAGGSDPGARERDAGSDDGLDL